MNIRISKTRGTVYVLMLFTVLLMALEALLAMAPPINFDFLYHETNTNAQYNKRLWSNTTKLAEKHHVVFIKMPKAGSTTVANAFKRFGMSRNLSFGMPKFGSRITYSQQEEWKNYISTDPINHTMDILTCHMVYNETNLKQFVSEDAEYISIIRQPLTSLASNIYYYVPGFFPKENKTTAYLLDPDKYPPRHLVNPMSYELGLPVEAFPDPEKITSYISGLDNRFSLMMIMEYMVESFVLLKHTLSWEWTDVIFYTKNVQKKRPEVPTDIELISRHKEISMADYVLYNYFLKVFQQKIKDRGEQFTEEVAMLRQLISQVRRLCDLTSSESEFIYSHKVLQRNITFTRAQCPTKADNLRLRIRNSYFDRTNDTLSKNGIGKHPRYWTYYGKSQEFTKLN